jgi:hypothetical protein
MEYALCVFYAATEFLNGILFNFGLQRVMQFLSFLLYAVDTYQFKKVPRVVEFEYSSSPSKASNPTLS